MSSRCSARESPLMIARSSSTRTEDIVFRRFADDFELPNDRILHDPRGHERLFVDARQVRGRSSPRATDPKTDSRRIPRRAQSAGRFFTSTSTKSVCSDAQSSSNPIPRLRP
jgi:hypothetical protein